MLLYNKALDANHTLLRITALLLFLKESVIDKEALRLFDFLIANPGYIYKLSVAKGEFSDKEYFKIYRNRYQNFDPRSLFNAMNEIHNVVMEKLFDLGVLSCLSDVSSLCVDLEKIPQGLKALAISEESSISFQAISFIKKNLFDVPVAGSGGLKKITNLMDYKYDLS